jgi:hypothetical protein
VANKAKSSKGNERDRRARVEAMRREQLARERRKSMIIVVVAVIVGAGLVIAAALPAYLSKRNDPAKKSLSSFGVSASAASCNAVKTTDGTNTDALRKHVADGTKEKYKTVPPSYGPHWATPVLSSRPFYTAKDRPEMEQLVHNLEHGYTIVWYDSTIKGDQLTALKDLSASARTRQAHRHLALGRRGQPHPALRQGERRGRDRLHQEVPSQRLAGAHRRIARTAGRVPTVSPAAGAGTTVRRAAARARTPRARGSCRRRRRCGTSARCAAGT